MMSTDVAGDEEKSAGSIDILGYEFLIESKMTIKAFVKNVGKITKQIGMNGNNGNFVGPDIENDYIILIYKVFLSDFTKFDDHYGLDKQKQEMTADNNDRALGVCFGLLEHLAVSCHPTVVPAERMNTKERIFGIATFGQCMFTASRDIYPKFVKVALEEFDKVDSRSDFFDIEVNLNAKTHNTSLLNALKPEVRSFLVSKLVEANFPPGLYNNEENQNRQEAYTINKPSP